MTTEEVEMVMSGYNKYVSPFVVHNTQGDIHTGTITYHQTTELGDGYPIGLISYAGGHVITVSFYPEGIKR